MRRQIGPSFFSRVLDCQRAIDGGNDAGKLDERAVAHQLELPSAMGSDLGIENSAAVGLEALQRARLVGLHHAAIADHVGGKYRGQFTLHQVDAPPSAASRVSAASIMALKRGWSRSVSRSGSALAWLKSPGAIFSRTVSSMSSAPSESFK